MDLTYGTLDGPGDMLLLLEVHRRSRDAESQLVQLMREAERFALRDRHGATFYEELRIRVFAIGQSPATHCVSVGGESVERDDGAALVPRH